MSKTTIDFNNIKEFRKKTGENQQTFWSVLGVTQSGGSRYESGRKIPKSVKKLLRLKFEQGVDVGAV